MPSPANAVSGGHRTTVWTERLVLIVVMGLYLWTFTPDTPNGDGWIYINSVTLGAFAWNPNHLYMQPTGLVFARLVALLGLGWTTFTTLKVLSALSAVVAVLLFHATLAAAGFRAASTRMLGALGLFFSAHYLSLSLAEEFFVIQMPVLAGIFLAGVVWLERREVWLLVLMGVMLAMVNGIQINSAVLAVALGLYVAWESRGTSGQAIRNLAAVWGPGIAIGVPMVLAPYALSSRREGLLTWLTSYQGQGGNNLSALYGLELTPVGVVKSAATLGYGFAISLAGLGDLGTVAEAVVTRRGLEFRPNLPLLASTTILFVLLGLGVLGLALWWWRQGRHLALGRFSFVWLASYLAFNFLWVDTADQFWAPILPALWLAILHWIAGDPRGPQGAGSTGWPRPALALGLVVVLLATANTGTVALYRAFTNVERSRTQLLGLLRPGDLVITTGWDDITWLAWDESLPYKRVSVMPLALQGRANSPGMKALPERIHTHLQGGGRVLVARLFEPDREARPWEQMARLGWPRRRVLDLLRGFVRQPVADIGSVHIDALTESTGPSGAPPPPTAGTP